MEKQEVITPDNSNLLNKKRNSSNNDESLSYLETFHNQIVSKDNQTVEETKQIQIKDLMLFVIKQLILLAESRKAKEKKEIIKAIYEKINTYLPKESERHIYVKDDKIIHPFNTKMNSNDFFILFCCAVDLRLKNFFISRSGIELVIRRRIFAFVRKNILTKNNIISDGLIGDLRKDYLLGLFTYENADYAIDTSLFSPLIINNYFDLQNEHDNYYKNNELYPNSPSNEPLSIFNRNDLSEILTSTPIIEIYNEVLSIQGFTDITNNDIKIKLQTFIDNINIYYLNTQHFGMTLFSGDIFLREGMVTMALESYGAAGCTILTLIHEIGHCLKRIIVNDNNFYLNTEPMVYNKDNTMGLKKNNIHNKKTINITDFGTAVEYILYKKYFFAQKIGINGGKFLLQKTSYSLCKGDFCSQLVKALKKDSSIEEGTYPLKRSSVFNLPIQCNKC